MIGSTRLVKSMRVVDKSQPKTMADHARSYRQRRARKLARFEVALKEIEQMMPFDDIMVAVDIARQALNPGKEMGE